MFAVSDEAALLIRRLVDRQDLPTSAGLRLATDPESNALVMSLAPQPRKRDVVIEHGGATTFVAPNAARRLIGQTLRAQVEGRSAFYLS